MKFKIHSDYKPTGDQPQAIDKLAEGIKRLQTPKSFGCYWFGKDFHNGKCNREGAKANSCNCTQ